MERYGEDVAASGLALTETTRVAAERADEAFALLVRRQSRFVFRVAFSVLRNAQDAEDVVQETFLKVYRSGGWDKIREERAFLARAAWRLAVSRLGRAAAQSGVVKDAADLATSIEAVLIQADLEAALRRLMGALPLELRLPLALSSVDEMSSTEIAEVMGIPEGTVRTRLARARSILRQKLEKLEVRHG